jgi:hypothetical protein
MFAPACFPIAALAIIPALTAAVAVIHIISAAGIIPAIVPAAISIGSVSVGISARIGRAITVATAIADIDAAISIAVRGAAAEHHQTGDTGRKECVRSPHAEGG